MSERFWPQAFAIVRRDLDREKRSGEVAWVTIPFGAIALLLVPLAVGINQDVLSRIGTGMLFVVVMLFGVLTAVRRTNIETPAQRDAIALLGIDPVAEFVGKTVATAVLLLAFEIVMGAVTVALYGLELAGWEWMLIVMPLTAIGLAELGTLSGAIASSVNAGPALVPLLVTPLAIPLLLGATQTVESMSGDRGNLSWLVLMAIVVLILAIVGVLTARPLQETR
ncbi:MAG: heme exporter protein CcmB [Acidimicrobiia bacterium]|nr:heme exporter protein CcmB [Acidimicrobiia bacterium]MDX2467251.1 heme exporter protein CcmB [Acidimicrobiia bacterium]